MINKKNLKSVIKKIKKRDRVVILIISLILIASTLYIFRFTSKDMNSIDDSFVLDGRDYVADSQMWTFSDSAENNQVQHSKGPYIGKRLWGADEVPRIMFWLGKVNQHWDLDKNKWMTDEDGTSGADLNKLVYCQKFYANTVKAIEYKEETTDTWRTEGNVGEYTSKKMSYRCVLDWEAVEGVDVSD